MAESVESTFDPSFDKAAANNRRSSRISTCQNDKCNNSGWLRCTECRITFYCSHKCKAEHADVHKPTCDVLAAEIAAREPKPEPKPEPELDTSFLSPSITPIKSSLSGDLMACGGSSGFNTPNVLSLADAINMKADLSSATDSPTPNPRKSSAEQSLEDQLREKDIKIAQLEKEKANLDAFVRKTLLAFKEKCVSAVTAARNEKQALEDQNRKLLEILEAQQAASKNQDSLLMSTIYELGLKIVERSLQDGKVKTEKSQDQSESSTSTAP